MSFDLISIQEMVTIACSERFAWLLCLRSDLDQYNLRFCEINVVSVDLNQTAAQSILCGKRGSDIFNRYFSHSYLLEEFIFVLMSTAGTFHVRAGAHLEVSVRLPCSVCCDLFGSLFQEAAVQSTASSQSAL